MTQAEDGEKKSHPLRRTFFTGIFFLVPMGITVWVLDLLLANTYNLAGPYVSQVLNFFFDEVPIPLVKFCALLLVMAFVFAIGWLAQFYFGKKVLNLVDTLMMRLPFIRSIYGGTKQIIEAFSMQKSGSSFKKVVLLEYPRKGSWVLGFVTNESLEDSDSLYGKKMVGCFVPSTPNPTTGFLLYYDPFEMLLLDLEVDEAVKLIVSAGLVMPDELLKRKKPVTLGESLGLEPPVV